MQRVCLLLVYQTSHFNATIHRNVYILSKTCCLDTAETKIYLRINIEIGPRGHLSFILVKTMSLITTELMHKHGIFVQFIPVSSILLSIFRSYDHVNSVFLKSLWLPLSMIPHHFCCQWVLNAGRQHNVQWRLKGRVEKNERPVRSWKDGCL